ncbi:MAG: hypothetical protein R3D26_19725 [Cyanobacteriota/Melainabacteria group bacterium]
MIVLEAMPDVEWDAGTGTFVTRKKWIDYFMANIERLYPSRSKRAGSSEAAR